MDLSISNNSIIEKINKIEESLNKLTSERLEKLEKSVLKIEKYLFLRDYADETFDFTSQENLKKINKHYSFTYSRCKDKFKCTDGTFINFMDSISGCRNVSSLAYAFYYDTYPDMRPQFVDGYLISLDDSSLRLKDGTYGRSVDVSFTEDMKCFCKEDEFSCIWRLNSELQISQNEKRKQYFHTVISVLLVSGERILVDWNIGQFQNLKDGNFVFVVS